MPQHSYVISRKLSHVDAAGEHTLHLLPYHSVICFEAISVSSLCTKGTTDDLVQRWGRHAKGLVLPTTDTIPLVQSLQEILSLQLIVIGQR